MASQVTLGNFFNVGGRNVLGGLGGSGLDTEALIEGLTTARRAPAVQLEDRISENATVSSALVEFRTLLSQYNSALDALRNPPGVGNEAENVFQYRTSSVSASDGTTSSNYLTVTASPGAEAQTYTVNRITQLATYASQSTGTITIADANTDAVAASPTAGRFTAGTIAIGTQNITIDSNDSLNDIASKFNTVSANTGISATVVKIADGQFRLSFTATETGDDNDFDLTDIAVDPDGVFDQVSMSSAVGAQNAIFYLNGIATAIERQTNSISDVVDGLTFTLSGTYNVADDPSTNLSVVIEPDYVLAQNTIVSFLNAYNELRVFAVEQTQLGSDGTYAEDSVLATNQTFLNIISSLSTQITTQVSGLFDGDPTSLAQIGISYTTLPADEETPEVTNILTTDDAALSEALADNFEGVARLFGLTLTSDSTDLKLYSANNSLAVTEFTLTIDPDTDTFEATYDLGDGPVTVDLEAEEIEGLGFSFSGVEGTALEGLVLIYGSEDASTIEVTLSQGIAALAYNTTLSAIEEDTGTIAVELESLADIEEQLQEDIATIDEQVDQYRELLIKQFAALEQVLSTVNNLLQSLSSNDDARNAASS